ncbi:YIP1 family protein [uncultured Thioclava sp.]|uniref:YIP1 family protein n=1 Tax=uncultured Thioclava sp. TaxID=473858 RepID=UPI0025EC24A8|nr:YIP1 family protein [uncultured Thioclava sp.]
MRGIAAEMAATDDIWRSYRRPRVVMREHLARARSEPRALVFLLLALTVIFIGQWPRLSRLSYQMPDQPMVGLMMGTLLALLAMIPVFYAAAALGHLGAKLIGGQGSWYGARVALFWALLAVSPLMLLQGLVAGFIGAGPQLALVSGLVFIVFVVFWMAGLRVAEFETETS